MIGEEVSSPWAVPLRRNGGYGNIEDMPYNPEIHHRRSIRLKEFDYTQIGAYFVTIVAQNREYLFGISWKTKCS